MVRAYKSVVRCPALSRDVMSDLAVLEQLAEPFGKDVVDIGCGGGALVRALTPRGARGTGIEISEQHVAPALVYDRGGGGALPARPGAGPAVRGRRIRRRGIHAHAAPRAPGRPARRPTRGAARAPAGRRR